MKIDYCYHTHTSRCGHARGRDEEYVLYALEYGMKVLGFSDHVMIPGVVQKGIRGDYSLFDDYINSIESLKIKYKDKIEIHTGFECEYSKELEPYYRSLLNNKKVEYLILGQHSYFQNNEMHFYFTKNTGKDYSMMKRYVDDLIDGIKSGLFKYLCHPDFFSMAYGDDERIIPECHRLLKACEEYDMPIEINVNGWKRKDLSSNQKYPLDMFWNLVPSYNLKVIIGVDAHDPDIFTSEYYNRAYEIALKYHLKLIDRIDI